MHLRTALAAPREVLGDFCGPICLGAATSRPGVIFAKYPRQAAGGAASASLLHRAGSAEFARCRNLCRVVALPDA